MMIFFVSLTTLLASFLSMFSNKFFWLSLGVLFVIFLVLLTLNLDLSDVIFLKGVFCFDMVSYSLIVLSLWITVLMIMSSKGIYKTKTNLLLFFMSVIILFFTLLVTFSVNNLLMFYFFFEFSLIPTLMIIGGWGYQPERIQAGIYFLFYTLAASLPLLVGLIYVFHMNGSLNFYFFVMQGVNSLEGLMVFFVFMSAFLVKMPMFFVHLWLPKAHVEAPVAGSMILAGVLLKLGGYGFYRIMPLLMKSVKIYSSYFYGLSILGMVYVGFMCCRLNDLKALVAYSSVAHMAMVICGILSFYLWGLTGGLMMMLAHGLASSGLFCFVNIFYERTGSRSFYLNKGLIMYLPLYTFLFFMFCISNMAAPPTLNLASEIFLMGGMMKFSYLMVVFFPLGSYLGAVFTLFLFSYSQHGRSFLSIHSMELSTTREFHLFYLHLLPVNYLILNLDYFVYMI